MSNSIISEFSKSVFDQHIKNKCSSYIDHQAQLNSIMQSTQKPKNYKKIKNLISNKIRKLINQTPNELKAKKSKKADIKLVKYNYKSNFVIDTETPARNVRVDPARARRYSNGTSSSSSTSSLSSCCSQDLFLVNSEFQSSKISHLFPEQSSLNMTDNLIQSSTPVVKNRVVNRNTFYDVSNPLPFSSYENDYSTQEDDNNDTCFLDESTQCQESPVLTESTFNNSSLSNLSDDLIILQTTSAPSRPPMSRNSTKKQDDDDVNLKIINKYHEDTNASFESLPVWALGHNLNLAIVNQLYFNPNGNGIFNANFKSN